MLSNIDTLPNISEIQWKYFDNPQAMRIIKLIYGFQNMLIEATSKNEPSILARYLIDLSKAYSGFYNEYKIITEDTDERNARVYLTYMTGLVLLIGTNLLGMELPDKM